MAETTYNITIPHTSPYIYYDKFTTECPETDPSGLPVCDNGKGSHVAPNSTATMRIKFVGSAIYVYGTVDEGMQYSWSLNYAKKGVGTPNGNLLIAAEDLKLDRFRSESTLEITLTQFATGARFQFTKADIVVGTGVIGAQTKLDSYTPGNSSIQLMTGWTANDTMPGYHYYQSNTVSSQLAQLNFQGAAVWVWGFCGPRGKSFSTGYGSISVDAASKDYISSTSSREGYIDHKCLIYTQSGLNAAQQHNISYTSDSYNVLLESIDVLQLVGGTGSSDSSTNNPGSGSGNGTSNGISIPTAAIIGGIIGGLVFLGLIGQFVRKVRQRARREIVRAAQGQVPTYPPVTTQSQVPTYTPVSTPSQVPTYAPPVSTQSLIPTYTPVSTPGQVSTWTTPSSQLPSSPPPPTTQYNSPTPSPRPFDYYSAPMTTPATPVQQPRDGATVEEVNRMRQEMEAMRATMYQQQQQQQNVQVHGEDGGYMPPPPEYDFTESSTGPSKSSGTWKSPRSPPPEKKSKN